jgi:catechol 2,3-dioxygenase-like lactoylglutathione lyase family enzyme
MPRSCPFETIQVVTIVGFHHVQVAMPPGGEDEAHRFYSELLGLDRVLKPEALARRGGAWFRAPGVEVHLGVEEGFHPARKAHPAFMVQGLGHLRRRLEAAGIELEEQPKLEGFERFHAFDPFGNRLEFIERSG